MSWSRGEFGKEEQTWKTWKSWMHQIFILKESTQRKYWSDKKMMNSYSHLQMVQQNCQEVTTNSEYPLQGNRPWGVKIQQRTSWWTRSLNRQKPQMTLKPVSIFGRSKVISSIVITMNFGFNSKCRGRKHSLFHWNILMLQGRLTLIWMCYKRSELTIIGMSIRADICLILEKDSQNSLCWQKNLQKEKCGPEGDWQRSKELPDLIMCGQKFGKIGKAVENREKQEGARGKPKLDNALRLKGIYLYWCRRQRILWSSWKRKKKTGKNCGSRDAVKKDIQASWKRPQSRRLAMKKSLKQCLILLWNLMNLWDNEQNLCSLKTVRITLQVKDLPRCLITMWCTSLFRCHKRWKFRMQKLPWTRNEWKKLETIPAWDLEKVKSKKEVILEAQKTKSTLLHWWRYVTSKMWSWNQHYRCTEAESCSGEIS